MSVVSRPTRKKSWQTAREVANLLDVLAAREKEIANRLEVLRKAHGLSQEAAAHEVGVSNRQWQRWASGESEPRASNLARISERFNVSVSELVGAGTETQFDRIEAKLDQLLDGQARFFAGVEGRGPEDALTYLQRVTAFMQEALEPGEQRIGEPAAPAGRVRRSTQAA